MTILCLFYCESLGEWELAFHKRPWSTWPNILVHPSPAAWKRQLCSCVQVCLLSSSSWGFIKLVVFLCWAEKEHCRPLYPHLPCKFLTKIARSLVSHRSPTKHYPKISFESWDWERNQNVKNCPVSSRLGSWSCMQNETLLPIYKPLHKD